MQNNKIKNIKPFWNNEYKNLDYRKEIFNDEYMIDDHHVYPQTPGPANG